MNSYIQHNPSHPGEILLELYLKPLNLSVTAASEQLLISRPRLSDIINGRAGISAAMALKLSKAFKTSPQLWLNLQSNYDLWQANQDNEEVKRVKVLVD
ncbi:MAG TPA: HigA family addiction module antitoxin [Chryseolinea sp.]